MPSGDVIIYTRHYMSAGNRGNIVQDIPRIHYARKRGGGGRRERRGGRRSMAGFYYRDHLFVNIIYTLRGGGFAVARATLSSTPRDEEGRLRRRWLLDTVDDFSRVPPPFHSAEPLRPLYERRIVAFKLNEPSTPCNDINIEV